MVPEMLQTPCDGSYSSLTNGLQLGICLTSPETGSRRQTVVFNMAQKSLPQSLAGPGPIRVSRRGFAS